MLLRFWTNPRRVETGDVVCLGENPDASLIPICESRSSADPVFVVLAGTLRAPENCAPDCALTRVYAR